MSALRGHHEGTIFYSKTEGRWVAAISLPNGRRRRRMATSPALARQALAELQREHLAGVDAGRLTTGAYLRSWLRDAPPRGPRTRAKRESIVRVHLAPALGAIALRRLTPADVQRCLNGIGLAPVTVGHIRSVLRSALSDAVRQGLLERNVASLATPPPASRKDRRWLSAAECRRLLDATSTDRLHALYVVAATTGLRQGELLALGWDDVDLDVGTIRVNATLARLDGQWIRLQPKTDHSRRTVVLTREAVNALTEHRRRMAEERTPSWAYHGLVFVTPKGNPIHGPNLLKPLRAYLAALGLPPITWHDLRHSAASVMLTAGVPLRVIADILGHSTIRITADLYAHVGPELQREAAEKMEKALR